MAKVLILRKGEKVLEIIDDIVGVLNKRSVRLQTTDKSLFRLNGKRRVSFEVTPDKNGEVLLFNPKSQKRVHVDFWKVENAGVVYVDVLKKKRVVGQ